MTSYAGRHLRRWTLLGALASAVGLSLVAPGTAAAQRFVPGEVIVRFEAGISPSERSASRARAGVAFKRSLPIRGAQLVDVRGSVTDAVGRLNREPEVLYAQPNFAYHATAAVPNDTDIAELWGLHNVGQVIHDPAGQSTGTPGVDIRALNAWDVTRGAGAVIAIVDTGVDVTHPDLAGNALAGFDFVADDSNPDDENSPVYHGTHVAGTAAATDNNGIGIAGVAPDARILPVRVLDSTGSGDSATVGAGVQYAASHGADAINLSLGGPPTGEDHFVSNALSVANDRNAVVVAAAGNTGSDNDSDPTLPCDFPQANLICVAAINDNGGLAGFSNYGPTTVDLGAPGESILSTQGGHSGSYHFLDGTSMAAPHVSGVAALVRRGDPAASDTQIVTAIKQSVRRLASLGSGFTVTGGIPDAAAAIRRARVLTTPPPPKLQPTPPGKAGFKNSKRRIRVSRTGRFSFSFIAGAGLQGRIKLVTVKKVRPRNRGRRKRATFGNKTFVVPTSRKVKAKFKLSRRNRRILKRYKKLRIGVSVKLRNSAHLTSTARVRITLKAPRRRTH